MSWLQRSPEGRPPVGGRGAVRAPEPSPGVEDATDGEAGGQPARRDPQVLEVDASAVRTVADLLELLGDMPSTPELLAAASKARAGDLTRLVPAGGGAAGQSHGSVDVSAPLLAAVAGLLDRLGTLGSTPPVVADDARAWAARLWERLEEPEPPAGHHPP